MKYGRLRQKKKSVKRKRKRDILNTTTIVNLFLFIFNQKAIKSEDQRCDATICGGYVLKQVDLHCNSIVPRQSGMEYLQDTTILASEVFNVL